MPNNVKGKNGGREHSIKHHQNHISEKAADTIKGGEAVKTGSSAIKTNHSTQDAINTVAQTTETSARASSTEGGAAASEATFASQVTRDVPDHITNRISTAENISDAISDHQDRKAYQEKHPTARNTTPATPDATDAALNAYSTPPDPAITQAAETARGAQVQKTTIKNVKTKSQTNDVHTQDSSISSVTHDISQKQESFKTAESSGPAVSTSHTGNYTPSPPQTQGVDAALSAYSTPDPVITQAAETARSAQVQKSIVDEVKGKTAAASEIRTAETGISTATHEIAQKESSFKGTPTVSTSHTDVALESLKPEVSPFATAPDVHEAANNAFQIKVHETAIQDNIKAHADKAPKQTVNTLSTGAHDVKNMDTSVQLKTSSTKHQVMRGVGNVVKTGTAAAAHAASTVMAGASVLMGEGDESEKLANAEKLMASQGLSDARNDLHSVTHQAEKQLVKNKVEDYFEKKERIKTGDGGYAEKGRHRRYWLDRQEPGGEPAGEDGDVVGGRKPEQWARKARNKSKAEKKAEQEAEKAERSATWTKEEGVKTAERTRRRKADEKSPDGLVKGKSTEKNAVEKADKAASKAKNDSVKTGTVSKKKKAEKNTADKVIKDKATAKKAGEKAAESAAGGTSVVKAKEVTGKAAEQKAAEQKAAAKKGQNWRFRKATSDSNVAARGKEKVKINEKVKANEKVKTSEKVKAPKKGEPTKKKAKEVVKKKAVDKKTVKKKPDVSGKAKNAIAGPRDALASPEKLLQKKGPASVKGRSLVAVKKKSPKGKKTLKTGKAARKVNKNAIKKGSNKAATKKAAEAAKRKTRRAAERKVITQMAAAKKAAEAKAAASAASATAAVASGPVGWVVIATVALIMVVVIAFIAVFGIFMNRQQDSNGEYFVGFNGECEYMLRGN
ncbi:MAG: hypothetical protein ACI4PV_03665, partial [Butyricicoccus sp.]